MFKHACKAGLILACMGGISHVAMAADAVNYSKMNFDSKINSWVEGTVMGLDADGGSISVRGNKRFYASTYAKMLNEIKDKTASLSGVERDNKEREIRTKWRTELDAARERAPEKDGDYTFYLPEKGKSLQITDETGLYDLENKLAAPPVNVKTTDQERAAILAFKDLKIGDRVAVGYESGVIYNNAYVVIKTAGNKTDIAIKEPAASAPVVNPSPALIVEPAPGKKYSNEMLATIRRSLVKDEKLSINAHNVRLQVENEVIILKGRVNSLDEKGVVEKKVADVVGANHVVNQLDVVESK